MSAMAPQNNGEIIGTGGPYSLALRDRWPHGARTNRRDDMTDQRATEIHNIAYLLASDERGNEWVQMYQATEMRECFSQEERAELAAGRPVVQRFPRGDAVRFVNMVAAARAVRD